MLYFEDFMEAIENLPTELNESLTTVRQLDIQSENLLHTINDTSKHFFENCKYDRLSELKKSIEHAELVKDYEKASALSREKCKIVDKIYATYQILMRKLDSELEKFRLELEADNSGITEQIENKTEMLLEKGSSVIKTEKRRQGFRFQRGSNFKTPFLIHRKIVGHACRTALKSSNVRPSGHCHKFDSYRNAGLHHRTGHSFKHIKDSMLQHDAGSIDDSGIFRLSDADTADSGDIYESKSNIPGSFAYSSSRADFTPTSELDFGTSLGDLPTELPSTGPSASPLTPKLSPFLSFPTPNLVHSEPNPIGSSRYHQSRIIANQSGLSASSATDQTELNFMANVMTGNTGVSGLEHRLYTSQPSPSPSCTSSESSSRKPRCLARSRNRRIRIPRRNTSSDAEALPSLSSSSKCSSSRGYPLLMSSSTDGINFDDSAADQVSSEAAGVPDSPFETNMATGTTAAIFGGGVEHGAVKFESHSELPALGGAAIGIEDEDDEELDQEEEEDQKRYCVCRDISYGDMIACDAPNCPFEWFHYSCVNLTVAPKGKWFCPNCVKNYLGPRNIKKRMSRR